MYSVEIEIEGLADLLFNGWTKRGRAELEEGREGKKPTSHETTEEAQQKVHRLDNGTLCIPGINFELAIAAGAGIARLKVAGSSLKKAIPATVFVQGGGLSLGRRDHDGIDESVACNKKAGVAVVVKRPRLRLGWRAKGKIVVTDDRIHPDTLRIAVEEAGLRVGIGSWRPRYGRFVVRVWNVQGWRQKKPEKKS